MHYARFEDLRADIVDILERWGYQVHWKVLDTRAQGVPQSRPRIYLAALLCPAAGRKFAFPVELPAPDLLRCCASWMPRARKRPPPSHVALKQTPASWPPLRSSGPARWTQPRAPA